jgi:ABC-type transporter MlaC component
MMIAVRRRVFAAAVFSGFLYPCIAAANDKPLKIIQKMYRDFLAKNYTDAIDTKKNRSRYFVPALARLYDADEVQACVSSIEATGQETINTAQIHKSLSIAEKSNDGKHAVVVSNFRNGGPPESFRYEFVKQGNAWKISDVIFPGGDRFSHTDCSSGRR